MSADAGEAPASLRMARSVLERETALGGDASPPVVAAALQRVCARIADNLHDAMGVAGCDALVARAVARAETTNPALKDLCRRAAGDIQIDEILPHIEVHGVARVVAAIEALLAALIDILSRLIGEDMAKRLIDRDVPRSRSGRGARTR